MILNLRYYSLLLPRIESTLQNNQGYTPSELISICSQATGAHVVVCGYYIAHFIGMSEDLQKKIDFLIDYYKIEEVMYIEEFLQLSSSDETKVSGSKELENNDNNNKELINEKI